MGSGELLGQPNKMDGLASHPGGVAKTGISSGSVGQFGTEWLYLCYKLGGVDLSFSYSDI